MPTVRSCVAAMLVLIALALGRDALSLRMVAVAAGFVLLLWPESAIGPSFQMSFQRSTGDYCAFFQCAGGGLSWPPARNRGGHGSVGGW